MVSFKPSFKLSSIYDGKSPIFKLSVSLDQFLLVPNIDRLSFVNVKNGYIQSTVEIPQYSALALSDDFLTLALIDRNNTLHFFDLSNISSSDITSSDLKGIIIKNFDNNNATCSCLKFLTNTLISVTFSDGTINIFNFKLYINAVKKTDCGIITDVYPQRNTINNYLLCTKDGKIISVSLNKSKLNINSITDAHSSSITFISFLKNDMLISCALDNTLSIWKINEHKLTLYKSQALSTSFTSHEASSQFIYLIDIFGDIWVINEDLSLSFSKKIIPKGLSITKKCQNLLILNNQYVAYTDFDKMLVEKLFVVNLRPVLACYFLNDSSFVFSQSENELVLVENYKSTHCNLLVHKIRDLSTQCFICISIYRAIDAIYIASATREGVLCLWVLKNNTFNENNAHVIAHTLSVNALVFSNDGKFLYSASEDTTIKCWSLSLSSNNAKEALNLSLKWTVKGHLKDINCLDFHPFEKVLISCSQDKTIKLWDAEEGKLLSLIKAHDRSIWSVRFVNKGALKGQYIITGSADKTVKIWSYPSGNCIRTFEHSSTVISSLFIPLNNCVLSVTVNGIVCSHDFTNGKLNFQSDDQHFDRIWGCDMDLTENMLLTYSDDCSIIFWHNNFIVDSIQTRENLNHSILKEQDLQNFISNRNFANAFYLCLCLEKYNKLFSFMNSAIKASSLKQVFDFVFQSCNVAENMPMASFLKHVREWNAKFGNSLISNVFLRYFVVNNSSSTDPDMDEIFRQTILYNNAYIQRIDDMIVDSFLIDSIMGF